MAISGLDAYSALLLSMAHKLDRANGRATSDLVQLIMRLRVRLSRPPRCVLLGEVNSGKSSLANLLIGEPVAPTSVIANSRYPIRFHHAANSSLAVVLQDGRRKKARWSDIDALPTLAVERIDVGLPVERLKTFEVIDMPGSNNPDRDAASFNRQRALGHIPIWCTVAARAWKGSERKDWCSLRPAQRAQGMLVVTQVDLLPGGDDDAAKVIERLDRVAAPDVGTIVPLATPGASAASVIGSASGVSDAWVSSGGARLELELERRLAGLSDQRVAQAQRALRQAFVRRGLLTDMTGDTPRLSGEAMQSLRPDEVDELTATLTRVRDIVGDDDPVPPVALEQQFARRHSAHAGRAG